MKTLAGEAALATKLRDLRGVFAQIRDALEARGTDRARSVTLVELSAGERRALAGLCGWREVPSTPKVKLSLAEIDRALRDSVVGVGLVEAVTALFGRLADRRAARIEALAEREALWARARAAVSQRPRLPEWIDDLRAHGRVARAATLEGTTEPALLGRVLEVVSCLPAAGELLPVFALKVLGDAHALDAGRAESALVLRAAAALRSVAPPVNALERRRLWSEVGVVCDALSADVLTLGLRPLGDGLLARHLREATAMGEPRRTTLRELAREQITVAAGTSVFVCENPSIVAAAADHHGARVQAVVCVEGVPSTAAVQLLRALSSAGAELRFHVDFDWGGLRIGNVLLEHLPAARPWRMGVDDYERSVSHRRGVLELVGNPVQACWDAELEPALSRCGVALLEEQVLAELLSDLGQKLGSEKAKGSARVKDGTPI